MSMEGKKQFKFRSFNEQISSIRIDVVHRVDHSAATLSTNITSDEHSFFHESLLKWRELNCSNPFIEFYDQVFEKTQSLPLIVHHKEFVIERLKAHLQNKDTLELESLLDLLVQLAKDLQNDFYPYFGQLFPTLVTLCHLPDAKSIEQVFTCLAYLFKYLWRQMLHDITNVFQLYSKLLLSWQKDYIRQFAVESFGFLLRKVRNVEGLCVLMLQSVAKEEQLSDGMGQLLFEVCKGIQKQFHSCTEKFLSVLYSKAVEFSDNDNVLQMLRKMCQLQAEHTRRDFSLPIWNPLITAVEDTRKQWSSQSQPDPLSLHLSNLLHLIGILISWREGTRVPHSINSRLHKFVIDLVRDSALPADSHLPSVTLHLIASLLLVSQSFDHTHKEILRCVFDGWSCIDHVIEFVWELLSNGYTHFDKVILKDCLNYCEKMAKANEENWERLVVFLTKLSLHFNPSSLPPSSSSPSLSFPSSNSKVMFMFTKLLTGEIKKTTKGGRVIGGGELDTSLIWSIMKCLQYSEIIPSDLVKLMKKLLVWIRDRLSSGGCDKDYLLLISQTIMTAVSMRNDLINPELPLLAINAYPSSLPVLQCVLYYYKHIDNGRRPQLMDLLPLLKANLTSPSGAIRSTTLQILNSCSFTPTDINQGQPALNLLQFCLEAETVQSSLETYRNKLVCLSKLKYSSNLFSSFSDDITEVPLRFLLGQLYVNFTLIWDPVIDLISSYASCSEIIESFWSTFSEILQYSSSKELDDENDSKVSPTSDTHSNLSCLNVHDVFESVALEMKSSEWGRPDHWNYRRLLWRCMEKFPKVAERKSRVIVPLLLNFIDKEYGLTDDAFIKTQDISKTGPSTVEEEGEREGENEREEDELTVSKRGSYPDRGKRNNKDGKKKITDSHNGLNKTLLSMLSLMSKLTNHRGLYCNDQLQSLYMKLLMSPEAKIQKLSLSCLKNYKKPYLNPYCENLELLLEEKSFREQLLLLNFSSKDTIVAEDHVEGLIPILLRLLYGLMRSSSKVNGSSSKKNSILRFVSSCGEREIKEMVDIMTSSLSHFNVSEDSNSLSPLCVVPLRRQHGFLQEMRQLLTVISTQLEPHLPELLPLFFSLSRSCNEILNTKLREQVEAKFINSLKTIRHLLISLMNDLLDMFHYVDLSPYVSDLLSCIVWPQLVRLHQECLQHPTPLLKLLLVCSQHHELYSIFTAPVPTNIDLSLSSSQCSPILHFVFKCLSSETVSLTVSQTILQLTLNLLKPLKEEEEQEDEEEEEESMEVVSEPFELGLTLLRPFIPSLLSYLSSVIREKGIKDGKVQLEFKLLSMICGHVTEKSEAEMLIDLLLPLLSNKLKRECDSILTSILNLIGFSFNIEKFYSPLSKLFSTLYKRKSRQLLCNIFLELAKKDDSLRQISLIIAKINSWEPTQIEEPDYEKRQEGFAEGRDLIATLDLSSHKKDCQLVLPILHNALFFIHESVDLSIRDGASSLLSAIIAAVPSERSISFDVLIMSIIIPSLKTGLRAKKESTISEFIDILSQLVNSYPNRFSELTPLSHSDPEVDFFKNVCHIQLHRRTKAYRKLAGVCSHGNLSQNTMTSYLLPLASHIVFSPLSSRETNMLQEAVNVIAAIASKLSWSNYYNLLRHYLHQLPKNLEIHRQIIRVVVAILDQFHFFVSPTDVSHSPTESQSMDEPCSTELISKEVGEGMETEDEDARNISSHIHKAIVTIILPSLQSVLTLQSEIPQHRLSHKENNFDSEKLRVPVAMAMTKLLLLLPKQSIQLHLSSLLLKVCQTMRSRAEDVRSLARTTLLKMLQSLGGSYLSNTLQELRDSLTRGYQLHVLSFTVHHLLHGLASSTLVVGDLDSSLHHFNEILIPDLFGHQSEEREVDKLINKIPEGKKCKSSHTYGLVARYLSPPLLPSLIQPLKEVIESSPSSKTASIVEDVLKRLVYGILSNKAFTPKTLLLFIHGTINRTIPQLQAKPKTPSIDGTVWDIKDSRLLPPKPSRSKPRPVYEGDVGAHLITLFGLQLFDVFLKKEKYKPLSKEMLEMLDPFVPLLTEALDSRHVKLLSKTIQSLMRIMKLPLPSLTQQVSILVKQLFAVLKHYGYLGSVCSDSNQELVASSFKAMTQVLQDFTFYSVSDDELKLLLSYVEQDVHDYRRQSTAFPLLNVILKRKLLVPELHQVMWKIAELVVTGNGPKVRANSRQCMLQFMVTYNLGKKINSYLDFFVANIGYEEQHGRESLLEMLNLIFNKFPEKSLQSHATYFFIPLSSQLFNDDSPLCRKMIAEILKTLLKRIGKEMRHLIVEIIKDWFAHEKLMHKQLAVQSLGIIVDIEGKDFERHPTFIPLLSESLSQDLSSATTKSEKKEEEREGGEDKMEETTNLDVSSIDHYLFGVLVTLEKIFTNCSTEHTSHSIQTMINEIFEHVFNHLLYPHAWVRYAASKLFGILFASCDVESVLAVLEDEDKATTDRRTCTQFFINGGRFERVQELQEKFIKQLKSPILSTELSNQTVKNLVYIGRILFSLSLKDSAASDQLEKLFDQMNRLCRFESGHFPKESHKRSSVFRWIAAISTIIGRGHLEAWLVKLLPPLHKEMKNDNKIGGEELHLLAEEVVGHVRDICGKSSFSLALSQISHKRIKK